MSTNLTLSPLAKAIIARFFFNSSLTLSIETLARDHDVTAADVRQALAQPIARHILRRDKNDLTEEQEYSAGGRIESVRDAVMMTAPVPEVTKPAPQAIQITPPKRKPLDLADIKLMDIPVQSRRLLGGRYDAILEKALETGKAITMPPEHVHGMSSTARDWLRRRQIKASIKIVTRMLNTQFGCVWIVKEAKK